MKRFMTGLLFATIAAFAYSPPVAHAHDTGPKYQLKASKYEVVAPTVATLAADFSVVEVPLVSVTAEEMLAGTEVTVEVAGKKGIVGNGPKPDKGKKRRRDLCMCDRCSGRAAGLIHIDPGISA